LWCFSLGRNLLGQFVVEKENKKTKKRGLSFF